MNYRMKVGFYYVDDEGAQAPFEALLIPHIGIKAADTVQRVRVIDEQPIAISRCLRDGDYIVGEFVRLHSQEKWRVLKDKSDPTVLKLSGGAQLGAPSAFCYEAERRFLAFELSRIGPGRGRVNQYLFGSSKLPEMHSILPIVEPAKLKALTGRHLSKIELKVAAPSDLKWINQEEKSIRENLVNLKEISDSGYVKIVLGMGHYKGTLGGSTRKLLSFLFRNFEDGNQGNIQALRAFADQGNQRPDETLDFLRAHLDQEYNDLKVIADDSEADFSQRVARLKRAFSDRKAQLNAYAKQNGS